MKNNLKKRFTHKNKNQKYINIIFVFCFAFAILLTTGYSIYRQQIANALSLSINKPIFTITLNNQSANSAGTTQIYEKYGSGYYLDSSATTQMTTTANGITKPTKTNYTFDGYYTGTDGSGTQYIDASGKLTASASNTNFTAAGQLYAKWKSSNYTVTVNATNGTPATQNKSVAPNTSTTFTVSPNTNYGNGTVSCTNSQTASLSGTTLTTGTITSDTVCTVTFQPKYTVSLDVINGYNDGSYSTSVYRGQTATLYADSSNGYPCGPTSVSCTNGQNGTYSGGTVTVSNVTASTTCSISYRRGTYNYALPSNYTSTMHFTGSSGSNCCCLNSTPPSSVSSSAFDATGYYALAGRVVRVTQGTQVIGKYCSTNCSQWYSNSPGDSCQLYYPYGFYYYAASNPSCDTSRYPGGCIYYKENSARITCS